LAKNWVRTGAELVFSSILVILIIALLQSPSPSVNDAQKYSGVVALALVWVFGHFQWFRSEATPRQTKTKQYIVDRNALNERLEKGYRFVAKIDEDHYIVEGK
jgi:hypothetical protein